MNQICFNIYKLYSIVFNVRTFVLAWVSDESMCQGQHLDYTKISFVFFSYAFDQNGFIDFLPQKKETKNKGQIQDFDF